MSYQTSKVYSKTLTNNNFCIIYSNYFHITSDILYLKLNISIYHHVMLKTIDKLIIIGHSRSRFMTINTVLNILTIITVTSES